MADVAQATVSIIPVMKGSQEKITKDLGGQMSNAGGDVGQGLGKAIMGGIAKIGIGAAVTKMIKDSVEEGGKLQQSFGGLDTLYGDAADQAKEYAYAAAEAGISANDYAEQAVSFGAALREAFGGDMTAAAESANMAILDMADNSAKMGTNLTDIQNAYAGFAKGNYTMLDNLKLGYGGTKEEMQRLLDKATELSGVEYDMDNLGDVYEAIHVIQEDLGLTGVAAQEAAETFSGSLGAMGASFKNLLADISLGNDITSSLQALGTAVNNFLIGNLMPMLGNVLTQIPAIIAEIPGFIADMLPSFLSAAANIVAGLVTGIVQNIPKFIAGIGQLFSSLISYIQGVNWGDVGTFIGDALVAGLQGLGTLVQGIWDGIVAIFNGDITFADIASVASGIWNGLVDLASGIWDQVVAFFTQGIDWKDLAADAKTIWDGLVTAAGEIWDSVMEAFGVDITFDDLSEAARNAWATLEATAQAIWDTIVGVFTGDVDFPDLSELASAAWSTLQGVAEGIWDAVVGVFTGDIDFPDLGEMAAEAWEAIKDKAQEIWDAVKGIFKAPDISFSDIGNAAHSAWDTVTSTATDIWDGVKSTFGASDVEFADLGDKAHTVFDAVGDVATDIWEGIKETFSNFEIEWPDFGELAQDALDGLKNAAIGVWDSIKSLFGGGSDEAGEVAVTSVEGTTEEMTQAFEGMTLKISAVDTSSVSQATQTVLSNVQSMKLHFDNFRPKIPNVDTSALGTALQAVTSAVAGFKSAMNFSWSLPALHGTLPVISVSMSSASSSDGTTTVSYPVFSVGTQWFAKGGIFNEPQIIGIGDSKGPEAAVPLDMMWERMGKEFDKHLNGGATVTNYIQVDGTTDPEAWATEAARTIKREMRMA